MTYTLRNLGLGLLVIIAAWSCKPSQVIVPQPVPNPPQSLTFPDDWLGSWQGSLAIYRLTGKTMEVPMQLDFAPLEGGRYTWRITYADSPPREYELYADTLSGRYWIDERNSIELVNHQLGQILVSRFEVEGQLLLVKYELRNPNELAFEVMAGSTNTTPTGGQDSIPIVQNYYLGTWQQAILHRRTGL